jgi:hypothetical protein
MPVIKPTNHTAPVNYPESNYLIAKYLDLTKFASLLSIKSIFLCRLDKLEDHFEGTTSKPNFERRKELYRTRHFSSHSLKKLTEEEIEREVKEDYEADDRNKALNCVSCWNKYESESAALWKIYSDFHKGIMIKSNIDKLISAFENTAEKLSLSEIKYIDYNKEYMPDQNTMYPVIHKHKAYSFEEELRLIHTVEFGHGQIYDWSAEKIKQGKYIKLDLNELIEEIVVSPYAADWYIDLIKDMCNKFGLNKEVKKSELAR